MRIIVASDHIGFNLKRAVIEYLADLNIETKDAGVQRADVAVDYPDYAQIVAQAVARGEYERGILVCGTGQGMVMAANKVHGVRAALCHDEFTSYQSRAHNNANVLCLGEHVVKVQDAAPILDKWLQTEFEGGRHIQRLAKLEGDRHSTSEARTPIFPYQFGISVSPTVTRFGPIVFAGRLKEAIDAAANAGFSTIELSLRSPDDVDIDTLQARLAEKDLKVAAIATGQACIEDELCLSNPDPHIIEKTIQHLQAIIRLASRLETAVILGGIRGRLTGTFEEMKMQRSTAIESIRRCAQYAAQQKVPLLLEPINRYETNFINSSRDGLKFIEEVGEPSMKLLLDTFHMNIEEVNIFQALANAGGYLGYVHVADSNRYAPGQGHIDFPKILETLTRIGYQGFVTAEILPLPDDETALSQAGIFLTSLIN